MRPKVAILLTNSLRSRVLTGEAMKRLESFSELIYDNIDSFNVGNTSALLKDTDACITCWGSIPFSKEILDSAPKLKLVAHSAGSVKHLVNDEFYARGLQITSAAAGNAISVAEHTLGMIITMLKRSFWVNDTVHSSGWKDRKEFRKCKALYNIDIGIIGAGHIGRHLIRLLKNFQVRIHLYDPFVTSEEASLLGVIKEGTVDSLMARCDVVSLHAPSIPQTYHMVNKDNLKLLMDGAVIINTARGSLIDEKALYEELKTGRISACLDVCDPEPMPEDSPLLALGNVILTQHTAGASFNDVSRMGDMAVTELENFFSSKPLNYPVRKEDLQRMA